MCLTSRVIGSSPLTRGKLVARLRSRGAVGLIPAHAGKTVSMSRSTKMRAAHPRSRGENRAGSRNPVMETGSSPLTRGKPLAISNEVVGAGLIPAHAGKTSWRGSSAVCRPAHPRSRGENGCCCGHCGVFLGSSPLTRGKHFPTCAFTAQIDQILETLELAVSSGSYSVWVACATDAPQDQVRSIGLVLPSSRGAS